MTKLRNALLLSSIAALFVACGGKSYSLGSPGAGQNAGGAANGLGEQSTAGGSLSMVGVGSSGTSNVTVPDASTAVEMGVPINHRAVATACPSQRGPGICIACTGRCATDSQCNSGTNGRCDTGGKFALSSCSYDECVGDSACPSGTPCVCRSSASDYSPNVCAAKTL
jgi:hypothetical protein